MKYYNLILIFIFNLGLLNAQPVINSVIESSTNISKYKKLELTVNLTATFNNAYDFSEINLQSIFISPSGEKDTVDGFYYQDYNITNQTTGEIVINGTPEWKVRFSPTEVGTWQYQVYCIDQNGTSNIINQSFDCIPSDSKGYIRTANNMFMKYDDGSQFFGVGENMCWATNQDPNNIIKDYRFWLDSLSAYNGNLIRIWMAQWSFAIEWSNTGLRNYSNRQNNAYYLDWLVNYAEQKDIKIEVCLNYHGQLYGDWANNPYNAINGGPCATYHEFWTNNTAKNNYKNRLRYINARWGYSTSIFSWEEFNEVDMIDYENGVYHAYDTEITDWHNEMGNYIRNIDVNNHLISSSCGVDYNLSDMWNLPIIDYTQTHYYCEVDEIENILVDGNQNYQKGFNKPTKNGEFGLYINEDVYTLPSRDPNAIHIHNGLWGSALSGSFGTAMSWWWDHYLHYQDINAYHHYQEIANFMSSIDLLSTTYTAENFNCIQNNSSFFNIIPMQDWGLASTNNFTVVRPTGVANTNELGKYLYSQTSGSAAFYNPPTFNVNFQNNGTFSVYTDISIGSGAIIEVILDGNVILHENAYVNSTYTISVPEGNHVIQVKSVGDDWIKVAKYIVDDNVQIKSNGLVCNNAAYGWVHNKNYNWTNVEANGEPQAIENSQIVIKNLVDGNYDVSFYNTNTGVQVSTSTYASANDSLIIDIPSLIWDYSFKITESTTTFTNNINKEDSVISVYPNPVSSVLRIKGLLENANITVFDVCGKQVLLEQVNSNTINFSNLKAGIYFVNISTQEVSKNFKVIKK